MPKLVLDNLEFRTPIAAVSKYDLLAKKGAEELPLLLSGPWQRRLESLWQFILSPPLNTLVSASREITASDLRSKLIASGTITLTLPSPSIPGESYFIFNNGLGVITIAGTINGNALGYQLTNQYQYVEVTSLNGTSTWIVTSNN